MNFYKLFSDDVYDPVNSVYDSSLSSKFHDFFCRSLKYKSVCGNSSKNLVLIEDFPNNVLRDPKELHNVLR